MLIGDPLDEGSNTGRPTRRAPEAAASQPSEGSSVLIGDPLNEGSNAGSTNKALRLRRERHAHR